MVQMSLAIRGYSRGYNYNDFYNYYYGNTGKREVTDFDYFAMEEERIDKRDVYDWLANHHTKRGDIKIELISPSGTNSVLLPYRNYDFINEEGYDNWPFMSVHYWGENPIGTWTLKITFKSSSGNVHMSDLSVTIYGTEETPEAVRTIPSQCDSACSRGCSGPGPENCDACSEFRVASTLECVDQCPNGTYTFKKYCLMCDSEHVNSSECQKPTPPGGNVTAPTPPGGNVTTPTPPGGNVTTPTPPGGNVTTPTPPGGNVTMPTPPEGNVTSPTPPGGNVTSPTPPGGNVTSPTQIIGTFTTKEPHIMTAPLEQQSSTRALPTSPTTTPTNQNDTEAQFNSRNSPHHKNVSGIIAGVVVSVFVFLAVGVAIGVTVYICSKKRGKPGFEFIPMEEDT